MEIIDLGWPWRSLTISTVGYLSDSWVFCLIFLALNNTKRETIICCPSPFSACVCLFLSLPLCLSVCQSARLYVRFGGVDMLVVMPLLKNDELIIQKVEVCCTPLPPTHASISVVCSTGDQSTLHHASQRHLASLSSNSSSSSSRRGGVTTVNPNLHRTPPWGNSPWANERSLAGHNFTPNNDVQCFTVIRSSIAILCKIIIAKKYRDHEKVSSHFLTCRNSAKN